MSSAYYICWLYLNAFETIFTETNTINCSAVFILGISSNFWKIPPNFKDRIFLQRENINYGK